MCESLKIAKGFFPGLFCQTFLVKIHLNRKCKNKLKPNGTRLYKDAKDSKTKKEKVGEQNYGMLFSSPSTQSRRRAVFRDARAACTHVSVSIGLYTHVFLTKEIGQPKITSMTLMHRTRLRWAQPNNGRSFPLPPPH